MSDLETTIMMTDNKGGVVELPLVNLLRITMVKLQPMIMEYLEQTSEPTVKDLMDWLAEKLGTKGKNVLL